jgi:hypothetical protein
MFSGRMSAFVSGGHPEKRRKVVVLVDNGLATPLNAASTRLRRGVARFPVGLVPMACSPGGPSADHAFQSQVDGPVVACMFPGRRLGTRSQRA